MPADDAQKRFDAFISYSHKDEEWVRDWLVPRLQKAGVKVCTDRIFDVGVPALDNMERAVAASRHTILVLTPAWVNSEWTLFESLLVQHSDPTGIRRRTLPLLLKRCKVPKRIDTITRVDFTGKVDIEKEFTRLIDAIRGDTQIPEETQTKKTKSKSRRQKEIAAQPIASIPRSPVVGFVARRDEEGREIVPLLKEELDPKKDKLIALWGKGGVGKSTLAAETVREMGDAFGKRIVWTSADGREDYSLSTLLDEIATQLDSPDLRRLALEPKKESVRALIASAPTLIVLDNFETISPGEQKNCAEWIAEHAPCPALITTRAIIDYANNIQIAAMSPPEALEYLNRLIAQAGNSRAFNGLDRDSIIQASDANPLVMRWVVARIRRARQPRDVLEDLTRGEGDAAERVFDRSFDLPQLGEDGRAALLALSLFSPSASRPALAEVAGFGIELKRLNEAIERLAVLCLVDTTDAAERLIIEGLTRELAKARLSKDERADEFRRRFVAYFLGFARTHAKTTAEDFDALESERDNVLSAMDVASDINDWQSVMGIMDSIGNPARGFLRLRGYWDEAISRGEQALYVAQKAKDAWHTGAFANGLGGIFADRGNYSLARKYYEIAVEIARKINAQQGLAATLHELGILAQDQGELNEARQLYDESLEINKKLSNQRDIASTLHQLGRITQDQGELDEARLYYDESLEISKKLGDQSSIASTLHQLGRLAQDQGEMGEARRLYDESLEIKKKLGDQRGIAITLHQLGMIAEQKGNLAKAAQLFREALTIFEKLGSPKVAVARRSLERVEGKE